MKPQPRTALFVGFLIVITGCATADAGSSSADQRDIGERLSFPPPPGTYSEYVFDQARPVILAPPAPLLAQVRAQDQAIVGACPSNDRELSATFSRLDAFTARVASMMDSQLRFTIYKARVTATGCLTAPRFHNAELFVPSAGSGPASATGRILLGIPGETRSLPSHQRDFLVPTMAAARVLDTECDFRGTLELPVVNSSPAGSISPEEFTSRRGPESLYDASTIVEAWSETWTFRLCGRDYETPVLLGADDRGGLGIVISTTVSGGGDADSM